MKRMKFVAHATACVLVLAGFAVAGSSKSSKPEAPGKVPITTSSDEARQLYLKARDLQEKLRATDARALYQKAVALDPNFALAHVGLATTSGTFKEFMDATTRAASLVPQVSKGERHIVLGLESGLKNNPSGTLNHYKELVKLYPNDERAHTLLGNTYFGRQEYQSAIEHLEKATSINPSFSQPYNQLGYAYRFVERFDDAERTFKKYIDLIPDDPNPYDSYAELLMKMGRFEESIKHYQKALSIDPKFIASYVGIGNDHLYMGHPDQARAAFAKITEVARTTGERRQAHFWTAAAYVHEGNTDKALDEINANYKLAQAENDAGTMAGDLNQMGDILREAGRLDDALSKYRESVSILEKAKVPEEVKAAGRRNLIFEEGRVAVAKNDVATAKARFTAYSKQVAAKNIPFEIWQKHELAGMIAQSEKRPAEAAAEFQRSNQQDPRILYLASVELRKSGKNDQAAEFAKKATKFNGLNFNYAFIRNKADKTAVADAQ